MLDMPNKKGKYYVKFHYKIVGVVKPVVLYELK